MNRFSPIICTWLESPKAALHAGSYCKPVAQSLKRLWSYGSTKLAILSESQKIVQLQVPIAWHVNGLSPIICIWLESPKAALYAESYCKPVAHTVVELWQHKIGNIIRIIENRPTSMPHSSKTKGDVTPTNGWLTIFKLSSLIWCKLHVHSCLRSGATGAQTYTLRKRLRMCRV